MAVWGLPVQGGGTANGPGGEGCCPRWDRNIYVFAASSMTDPRGVYLSRVVAQLGDLWCGEWGLSKVRQKHQCFRCTKHYGSSGGLPVQGGGTARGSLVWGVGAVQSGTETTCCNVSAASSMTDNGPSGFYLSMVVAQIMDLEPVL